MQRTIAEDRARPRPGITIRDADLEADRDLLVEVLQRNVNPSYDHRRFDWGYRRSPSGRGRAWIAVNGPDVVGVAGAFPRNFVAGARPEAGWVLGDFCITERYRSLGPALELQRACLAAARREGIRLCYDAPSESMMAVYARLGISSTRTMVRLARPLKIDRHLGRWLKAPAARRVVAPAMNALLSLDTRLPGRRHEVTIQLHEGPCGDEFTNLAGQAQTGIRVSRTGAYLTWRYLDTPVRRHEILTARQGGMLCGYAAFWISGDEALVADLFVPDGAPVARPLVRALLRLLRQRDVATVSAPLLESDADRVILERFGFRPRETKPIVTIETPAMDMPWFLSYGDLDG